MSALWTWVRLDIRGRAKSLAILALLVALTTGVVLTAVAGARRGSTALDRLLDRTQPATVAALPNEPGFDWNAVEALPGVAAISRFPISAYVVEGLPADEAADFAYADDEVMRTIERPVVLEGRLANAARDDEAVITEAFEDTYGKGVGDTVTVKLYSPEQVDEFYLSNAVDAPAGPKIETRIVGVVRSAWFSDGGDSVGGRLIPSPGLFSAHPRNLVGGAPEPVVYTNALVRLDGGADAIPRFRKQLAEVSGRSDIEFMNLAADADHANDVADFEANALLAFAAAAFVAAVFLVGQAVARYVAGAMSDLHILSTFGMPPRQVRAAAAAGPTLAAAIGVALGVSASFLASPRFPMGTAAPFEPSPGRHADLTVIAIGTVGVVALVAGGAVVASWMASRSVARRDADRPSAVSTLAARLGAPVPFMVGSRFALERGRGANAVPVYPALVGAVVGVLGVLAALTFGAGVSDAAAHPERFGQVTDLQAFLGFNGEDFLPDSAAVLRRIAEDPDVVAVNDTRQAVAESGSIDFPVFALAPVGGRLPIVVTSGHPPAGSDEITLGPETADALGVGVGDTVDVTGKRSSGSYTVSGIGFVPEGSHNTYDTGAWMGPDAYDDLFEGFKFHTADVTLRSGAEPSAAAERIGTDLAASFENPELKEFLQPPEPTSRLAELQQIRRLPLLLAAFLALLAVAAVGHAVATTVRRRRHDLAVLRALGLTRWQCRATVLTQATLLAVFGLAIGVPVGLALGRTLWRGVADSTPIDYVAPMAVMALLLIAPMALLAANLLAAWPSHRAATMRVGHVLRTE